MEIGKVMLKKTSITMADEPTASLDPTTAEEILKLLFQLRNEKRLIIIATHNPEVWEKCDEIVKL